MIRDSNVQLMDLVKRRDDIQTEGEGFEKSTLDVITGKTLIRLTIKKYKELRESFPNDIGTAMSCASNRLLQGFPKEVVAEMEVENSDRQQPPPKRHGGGRQSPPKT